MIYHWYMTPGKLSRIKALQIYVANVNNMMRHFIMLSGHGKKLRSSGFKYILLYRRF